MDLLAEAVANNVAWCALLGPGSTDPTTGIWRTDGVPWPLFPDAATTRPGVRAVHLADALADRPACSVKDSFADLDLAPHGFRVLFTGQWIARTNGAETVTGWSRVTDAAALARWCATAGLPDPLPAHLLDDPTVRVLAGDGRGLITTGTDPVVGLSNVHGPGVWEQLAGAAPGRPVVGYEHGEDLEAALAAGFTELGPVRVWLRP